MTGGTSPALTAINPTCRPKTGIRTADPAYFRTGASFT